MVGGVGAGIVIPVKMGAAAAVGSVASVALGAIKSTSAGAGPNIA